MKTRPIFFLFFLCIIFFRLVIAEENITPIKLGMSGGLTGVTKEYGKNMSAGINAYFSRVNDSGGINGNPLQLIVLDDSYVPERAAANVHKLISEGVLGFIGNIGTPTILVEVPIINKEKVLLFAPYSGSEILHKTPPDRYVFNLRAGYDVEVSSLIKGILSTGVKPEELAFFSQNDSYGDSIYKNAMQYLKSIGYKNPEKLPYGRYVSNTGSTAGPLGIIMRDARLNNQPFKAILMGGNQVPNLEFIKLTRAIFPNTIFLITSPGLIVLDDAAKNILEKTTFVLNEVVPSLDSSFTTVQEYHGDLKKYFPQEKPSYISLEGYIATKLLVIAIKKAAKENNLTREGLIETLESLKNVDIGIGTPVSFDKNNHDALQKVWPVTLKNGELVAVDWKEIQKLPETPK